MRCFVDPGLAQLDIWLNVQLCSSKVPHNVLEPLRNSGQHEDYLILESGLF